jgi:hypothetical protein
MSEAPLITKALRLVSLALIVGTIALVAAVGYSGVQEIGALTSAFSPSSSSSPSSLTSPQSGNGSSSSTLSEQLNGTTLLISGIRIPNNMTFPLDFQLSGYVGLAGVNIGNFATPLEEIMPGQTLPVSLAVGLDFAKALSNQTALDSLLFNSTKLTFHTEITANMVPLLRLNLSSSSVTQVPAILGNFNVSPGSPSCALQQNCTVPIQLSWNNPSPIGLNGALRLSVTRIPGLSGPYPNATVPFNVIAGSPGNETAKLVFSWNDASHLQPGEQIGLLITFNAYNTSFSLPENVTIP